MPIQPCDKGEETGKGKGRGGRSSHASQLCAERRGTGKDQEKKDGPWLVVVAAAGPSHARVSPEVIDGVATQRARVLVAALEPLVQTGAVEEIAAGAAAFVGHALVRRDDGVANGALGLALERADHVAAEGDEPVDDAAVLPTPLASSLAIGGSAIEQRE